MGIKVNNIADVTEVNGVADIAEINGVTVPAGGIALVQSASGTAADGSAGLTVNFGVPVTAGNSVLAFTSRESLGGGYGDPTMVGGDAAGLTAVTGAVDGNSFQARIDYIHNLISGETGVTWTNAAAVRVSMTAIEVSGLADTALIDTDTNTGTGSLASLTGLTGTGACFAIFAVENATDPFVGLASNVNVTGIGAGNYTNRGIDVASQLPWWNIAGQPDNSFVDSLGDPDDTGVWHIYNGVSVSINESSDRPADPWDASWTGSVVTESPSDWTLVTIPPVGGSNVWQCVAWKVGAATPVSVELTASLPFAAAGVVFEAA